MEDQTPIRLAQAIGLTATTFGGGVSFACSWLGMPPLRMAPTHLMLKQWLELYHLGTAIVPYSATLGASAYAYLAYTASTPRLTQLYSLSAVLIGGIIPFTLTVIFPTNHKLEARLETLNKLGDKATSETDLPKGESSDELMQKWIVQNYIRASIALSGAVVGAYTILF